MTAWLAPAAVIANTKAVSRMSAEAGRGGQTARPGLGSGALRWARGSVVWGWETGSGPCPLTRGGSGAPWASPTPTLSSDSPNGETAAPSWVLPTLTLLQDAPEGLAMAGAVPAAEAELELAFPNPQPGAPR